MNRANAAEACLTPSSTHAAGTDAGFFRGARSETLERFTTQPFFASSQ